LAGAGSGPAGVTREPGAQILLEVKQRLGDAARDMRNAVELLWKSSSVRARFENTGVLSRQAAEDLGIVGPARARKRDRPRLPARLSSTRLPR